MRDESSVVAITTPKYPPPTSPLGNAYTTNVAIAAIPNRAQNAYTHGRRICPCPCPPDAELVSGCRAVGAGRAHFAASQPAVICAGKSRRTAMARSSLESPFSRSFRPVTESFTWNPILHTK